MKHILGRLLCSLPGGKHKRGKLKGEQGDPSGVTKIYACPRCGATWSRKVKPKLAEPTPIPESVRKS